MQSAQHPVPSPKIKEERGRERNTRRQLSEEQHLLHFLSKEWHKLKRSNSILRSVVTSDSRRWQVISHFNEQFYSTVDSGGRSEPSGCNAIDHLPLEVSSLADEVECSPSLPRLSSKTKRIAECIRSRKWTWMNMNWFVLAIQKTVRKTMNRKNTKVMTTACMHTLFNAPPSERNPHLGQCLPACRRLIWSVTSDNQFHSPQPYLYWLNDRHMKAITMIDNHHVHCKQCYNSDHNLNIASPKELVFSVSRATLLLGRTLSLQQQTILIFELLQTRRWVEESPKLSVNIWTGLHRFKKVMLWKKTLPRLPLCTDLSMQGMIWNRNVSTPVKNELRLSCEKLVR